MNLLKEGTKRMQETAVRREMAAYDGMYNRFVKRVLDVCISGCAIALLWPFYLAVALVIAVEDGFPIFYRAERGGYRGKTFRICKFRTMVKNAGKIGGGTTSLHDPRITKTGNFLRKTKMDELPQLFQVFTGKMSLVGPRPELLQYVDRYTGAEEQILRVRPGITDYSSVTFISLDEIVGDQNADEMYEKFVLEKKNALRVEYAETVSFRTDCRILMKTAEAVLKKANGYIFRKEHR